jgi:hypothetical protein
MKVSTENRLFKSVKNFFKDVLKKEKQVETKPESQIKEEKNKFYRPEKIKCAHTTYFYSQTLALQRAKRKIKSRIQKHSRKMNRAA